MTISRLLYDSLYGNGDGKAIINPVNGRHTSYADLRLKSAWLNALLKDKGLKQGDRVAILLDRDIDYPVAMAACLIYGYCAVLLDTAYPNDRIEYALKDAGVRFIINREVMSDKTSYGLVNDKYEEPSEDTDAVIIYTSGSTGRAKGVLHDQRSVGEGVFRLKEYIGHIATDRCLAASPFTFVVCSFEILAPLCAGARIYIAPRETAGDPHKLADFIERHKITAAFISPRMLRLFKKKGDSIRVIMTASEKVTGVSPDGYRLVNAYGLSECFGGAMCFDIDRAYENTPIGKPIGGIEVSLLREDGTEAGTDEKGEIVLKGHFFKEYINQKEETDRVITHTDDGFDILHTGDIGISLKDGNILYCERNDFMLKINGQRVEPGEIETALRTYPGIKDAVVKGFDNGRSGVLLAAYYTANEDLDAHDMRSHLEKRLVHYMVPSRFVRLDELPKNDNGKLDRSSLTKPADDRLKTEYVKPVNDTQKKICDAMAAILGTDRVGITDDFFDLGGDSIGCASLITDLPDLDIEIRLIYEHRTAGALAAAIDRRSGKSRIDIAEAHEARQHAYPLLPYQLYYVDYTLYSPGKSLLNNPVYICFPKDRYELNDVKEAVRKATDAYSIFRTIFEFSESGDLIQRYDPDIEISFEVKHMSEEEFIEYERAAFVRPFNLIGVVLWRAEFVVTEANVIVYFDFHHSIGDGTSFMEYFRQIFVALSGQEPGDDLYYLYLKRYNERMKDPKVLKDMEYLDSLYEGEYVNYPEPDLISRDNTYARIDSESTRSYAEYEMAASKMGVSLGNVFVAAGLIALGRYSQTDKVLAGWLYNGRDERWKEHIIGPLLSGMTVALDLSSFGLYPDRYDPNDPGNEIYDRKGLLNEVKKQSETGIRYSEYSYSTKNMSPAEDERMVIVYEHGIGAPDMMPDDVAIHDYFDANTGTSCLYQVLIFEKGSDLPFTLLFNYMDSRYSKEVAMKYKELYIEALDELCFGGR